MPFSEKTKTIPDYGFTVMAPQRWRISEWKNERLSEYIMLLREVTIFRGNGDVQLGKLRDTYYQAEYGVLTTKPNNVVRLQRKRSRA